MKTRSKKFMLCCAIGLLSLAACTTNQEKKAATTNDTLSGTDTSATYPPNLSMNGIPEHEAIDMIKAFRADSTVNQPQVSMWFDKEFINVLLETAKNSSIPIDGVRIHMAKRDNKNTVVVLLTTNIGKSPTHKRHDMHKDLFMPYSNILSSLQVQNKDSYEKLEGADLYRTACTSNCTGEDNENFVDCKTAKAWVDDFSAHYKVSKLINLRSLWYDLDLFKELQGQIRSAEGQKSDGIRLYFGRRDNNKHVFLLVPTTEIRNGFHRDNYQCYLNLKNKDLYDRGEECTPFCDGVVVP